MRLESIAIENFRRFRAVRVEFPDGVVGLVGRNGSGKSSLIEAIGWALFGHEAARTGKEHIKRRGAPEKEDCRVALRFTVAGAGYEIERALVGKAQSHVAKVTVDGQVVVPPGAASQREATAYLERALHLDAASFFTSAVARQKELNALTDMTPGKREETLLGMLRIDAIDDAIRLARERKRELRARLDGLTAQSVDPKSLDARAAEAEAARAGAAARRGALAEEMDRLANDAARLKAERDASQARAERHAALAADVAGRRERLRAAEAEAVAAREELARLARKGVELESMRPKAAGLAAARAEAERLALAEAAWAAAERRRADLSRREAALTLIEAQLAQARADLETRLPVRRAFERVRQGLPGLSDALNAAEKRLAEANARIEARRREADRLAAHVRDVERLGPGSACPTCERPLGEHHETLLKQFASQSSEHAHALALLDAERGQALGAVGAARAALQETREREAELSVKAQDLARVEARASELAARADAERGAVAALRGEVAGHAAEAPLPGALAAARARAAEAEAAARQLAILEGEVARRADVERLLGALAARIEDGRAALAGSESSLAGLAFDPAAHRAAIAAAEAAAHALAQAQVAFERAAAEVARATDALAALAAERERQAAVAREATAVRVEVAEIDRLAGDRDGGLLVDFKSHLIARVRPLLSAHAGAAFRDLTDGKYAGLEVDADYDLLVEDDGERFPLDRYSGGEADLANLCLRLAVSQVLAERAGGAALQFVALDEIFGSQDEVRKGNILRALSSLSGKFRQILVVTHIEDVKDAVEHVLRVTESPDGTSDVSVD